ncbi:MAG TPA: hypothetical protein DG048_12945 [Pseudoalteromonas sp.]|nr:hypothetical protein [Pseudoalteromonas sp.]|tara:strand:+ start:6953 stop:7948 length:996 start_codon:yes stop_codon:yes gene_type:complete
MNGHVKNNTPFFTVIIPTRNRPVEFKAALDSVLEQSYSDIEIFVVNDGTTSQFKNEYQVIKNECPANVHFLDLIERSRGHGHCFARNEGVDASSGKFICFLDDDDTWTDTKFLERAKQEIEQTKADLYIANQKAVKNDGEEIKNVWVEDIPSILGANDSRLKKNVFEVEVSELLRSQGFAHQNACIVSRSLFVEVDGMDENMRYEPDRDIYLRLLDKSECILYDTNVVALHNVPDKSKSTNASTKTNKMQKLLFQLRTANKGLMFCSRDDVFTFCKTFKTNILKHIATEFLAQNKFDRAAIYAKQALAVKFTIKWFLMTQYLRLRAIMRKP